MNFTRTELEARGWQMWNADDRGVLMICPLEDFYNIPDGTEMWSIWDNFGGKAAFKLESVRKIKGIDDIDKDTRNGMMAWGVFVKNEDSVVATIQKTIKALTNH